MEIIIGLFLFKVNFLSLVFQKEYMEKLRIEKEIIEMYKFTVISGIKSKTYLITFVTRTPRQSVGFDIAHDKSKSRIQKIADKAPKAKFYFSDANPGYRNVSY